MTFDPNKFDPKTQIAIVWSVEDVQSLRPDLTQEQAFEVLTKVKTSHDAESGVNWLTLSWWAEELYPVNPPKMRT